MKAHVRVIVSLEWPIEIGHGNPENVNAFRGEKETKHAGWEQSKSPTVPL